MSAGDSGDYVLLLVAVVQDVVDAGHYQNYPEGLMGCAAFDTPGSYEHPNDEACDCGWTEAKAALDAYRARDDD